MDNELFVETNATPILENASKFNDFLSSETIKPVRSKLKIIPNIVQDICDFILENRQQKMQERQFNTKVELFHQTLKARDRDSQRKYDFEIEKIHLDAKTKIYESNNIRDAKLAEVEANKLVHLAKIRSNEKTKIKEIESNYKLEKKRLDNSYESFNKLLKESNRRFNSQIKNFEKVQSDFSNIINAITQKLISGKASEYELELLKQLSVLKTQCFDKDFDVSYGLISMFGEGN